MRKLITLDEFFLCKDILDTRDVLVNISKYEFLPGWHGSKVRVYSGLLDEYYTLNEFMAIEQRTGVLRLADTIANTAPYKGHFLGLYYHDSNYSGATSPYIVMFMDKFKNITVRL